MKILYVSSWAFELQLAVASRRYVFMVQTTAIWRFVVPVDGIQ